MPREFESLRAIVTGGASGIGAATTALLLERGCRVAVLDLAPAAAPADSIAIGCDIGDTDSVVLAVADAINQLGGLDILVNNAGIGAQGDVMANPEDEWQRVFNVNVFGIMRVTRAALPALRNSRHAAIVNTSSIAATAGLPQRALYSASKGAVHALTLAMAADHLPEGIRVNAVAPGTADTPWVGRLLESAENSHGERAALEARQPHGRLVSAAEVANAIAYLASPRGGSSVGVTLHVDGGMDSLRLRPAG
ncbi:MAG TPA: SDR family oxidoreductase [Galbitalea sp.]|jgi:NAD(P)-dependent dehydrogenase (short-subunit alcohol dehydrogenase family)|nr:SDR family oxidoreductase [Galbitalea sp.]